MQSLGSHLLLLLLLLELCSSTLAKTRQNQAEKAISFFTERLVNTPDAVRRIKKNADRLDSVSFLAGRLIIYLATLLQGLLQVRMAPALRKRAMADAPFSPTQCLVFVVSMTFLPSFGSVMLRRGTQSATKTFNLAVTPRLGNPFFRHFVFDAAATATIINFAGPILARHSESQPDRMLRSGSVSLQRSGAAGGHGKLLIALDGSQTPMQPEFADSVGFSRNTRTISNTT